MKEKEFEPDETETLLAAFKVWKLFSFFKETIFKIAIGHRE